MTRGVFTVEGNVVTITEIHVGITVDAYVEHLTRDLGVNGLQDVNDDHCVGNDVCIVTRWERWPVPFRA